MNINHNNSNANYNNKPNNKKQYQHLSKAERYEIKELRDRGYGMSNIAQNLGRSKSTVSMELRRNRERGKYMPCVADEKYRFRIHKADGLKIEKNLALRRYIVNAMIEKKWAPDAISGRLRLDGYLPNISTESIYKFIYVSPIARKLVLYLHLPSKRMVRQIRGARRCRNVILHRVSIHERATIAKQKVEIGHFEADLTFHKGNQSTNIGSMIDKASQKVMLVLNATKKSLTVTAGFLSKIKTLPPQVRKTLTMDNGKEFMGHTAYRLAGFMTFFCDPYRPRQKALVEKMNSMIHRILPKSMDITMITQKTLDEVAEILNNMPRKIFGYKTPNEVWEEKLGFVLLSA